jgi:hypothetical protein
MRLCWHNSIGGRSLVRSIKEEIVAAAKVPADYIYNESPGNPAKAYRDT